MPKPEAARSPEYRGLLRKASGFIVSAVIAHNAPAVATVAPVAIPPYQGRVAVGCGTQPPRRLRCVAPAGSRSALQLRS
jgi:hypothetical protein